MLLIKSKDEGSQERVLTLSTGRAGKGPGREVALRIYNPDGKSEFGGNLLASIVLSEADVRELKRNL